MHQPRAQVTRRCFGQSDRRSTHPATRTPTARGRVVVGGLIKRQRRRHQPPPPPHMSMTAAGPVHTVQRGWRCHRLGPPPLLGASPRVVKAAERARDTEATLAATTIIPATTTCTVCTDRSWAPASTVITTATPSAGTNNRTHQASALSPRIRALACATATYTTSSSSGTSGITAATQRPPPTAPRTAQPNQLGRPPHPGRRARYLAARQ